MFSCCARVGQGVGVRKQRLVYRVPRIPLCVAFNEDGRLGKQRCRLLLRPEEARLATCHAMQPRQVLRTGIRRRLVYRDVRQCHEPESRHQVSEHSVYCGCSIIDVYDAYNIHRVMLTLPTRQNNLTTNFFFSLSSFSPSAYYYVIVIACNCCVPLR